MTTPAPRRLTTVLIAGIGGFLTDSAFPMRGIWILAFFGVAALFIALQRESARWSWVVGTTWGLGFFLPHLWWAHAAVGPIPWVALSLLSAMIIGTAMSVWAWIRRSRQLRDYPLLQPVIFALLWMAMEYLRHYWPFGGFPWGRLAFSQVEGPVLRLAAYGGAPLVSGFVALVGAAIGIAYLGVRQRQIFRGLVATALASIALVGSLLVPLPQAPASGNLWVGAVQGNVSQPGLHAFSNRIEVLTNHVQGTQTLVNSIGAGELDVVIWPENSSDVNPRADATAYSLLDEASKAAGVPILFGTDNRAEGERYNEMVLWEVGQDGTFAYAKQVPAAFAEYIPMRELARKFSSAVDLVQTDMSAGQEVAIVPVPVDRLNREVVTGVAICFEVAYDWVLQEAVIEGAEVLIVPTNNASFGYTAESEQQLAMTKLRAVELGRAAVQISTVGVSGIFLPNGQQIAGTDLFTADQMYAEVPLRTDVTIAAKVGDWPTIIACVISGIYLIAGFANRAPKKEKHR